MEIPSVFCWTKMGTEAGQPLETILARKEAERELGAGVFFWGIGNALGPSLWRFIASASRPMVFFTLIKSKPKQIDVTPKRVVAWRSFVDRGGIKHPMPDHVFVTSRAAEHAHKCRSHFALVCFKRTPLLDGEGWGSICIHTLTNLGTASKVAFSQVTAVVQAKPGARRPRQAYDVLFAAELAPPYYVKLVDAVDVPPTILSEINNMRNTSGFEARQWREYLEERCAFRRPAASGQSRSAGLPKQAALPFVD